MKFTSLRIAGFLVFGTLLFSSCSNKTEQFDSELLENYTQTLQPGKYITYRLDSLVFTNFGRTTEIHKYQQKHVVDAQVTDNLGRPAWRVFRYIRDSVNLTSWTPAQPWIANGSYLVTVLPDQVEVSEDNLRIIKLHAPFREGFTWKGNKFLASDPYASMYNFSNDDNMADWDYYYDTYESDFSYGGQLYNDVWTLESVNESFNVPIVDPAAYASQSRMVDRYAKNIGLVYRHYELWEYQPNPNGAGGPFKTGFGITMWMVDHN